MREVHELNGSFTFRRDYVYGGKDHIVTYHGSIQRHVHKDHLGSTRVTTSPSGNVVTVHAYWPFGEEMTLPASQERMRFAGHERDASTGYDYMHARYYASVAGRFLSVDPGRDYDPKSPQSFNLFAYAANNPLTFADSDGRVKVRKYGDMTGKGLEQEYTVEFETRNPLVDRGLKIGIGRLIGLPVGAITWFVEKLDESLKGEWVKSGDAGVAMLRSPSGKAGFERDVATVFRGLAGEGSPAGIKGVYTPEQLKLLNEAVKRVTESYVRQGKLSEEEAKKIREEYAKVLVKVGDTDSPLTEEKTSNDGK
ncbi:MAG: RHS repeat domain-containing protein [Candidatus Hadarchaeum sp.]|uniref:RHS repeat domain-containing protein n=1 Tax=Candidatus Hadarchaeum sp. TaxID=2883567 RepID=UPI003D152364